MSVAEDAARERERREAMVARMEPEAHGEHWVSIAISMKRIADALDGDGARLACDRLQDAIRLGIVRGNRESPRF